MKENDFIKMFAEIHGTTPYSADAECVKTDKGYRLFSIDGFSETEDFFTHTPPERIGHNMAVAACSDLLACGVKPELVLQSWNIDNRKSPDYYREIAVGIEKVLKHYGAKCIGGDMGCSQPWSYTVMVTGQSKSVPVRRIASKRQEFDLYASGHFGDCNIAMFLNEAMPELEVRKPVPPAALFATDSSGGFFDALENFRRVNHGLHLDITDVPKIISMDVFGKWPEDFDPFYSLIGGVGEYELLFAMPKGIRPNFGRKIGQGFFTEKQENEFNFLFDGKRVGRMKNPPPDYRNIPPEKWMEVTIFYFKEIFS